MSTVNKDDDDITKYERTLEQPTTYSNDYKWPIFDPEIEKKNITKEKKPVKKSEDAPKLKIPFDFYFERKPPNLSIREILDELKDKPDQDQKFDRPRVYKCPEVSLDDIPDKNMRDSIIKFVYTSETKNFMEGAMRASSINTAYDDCIDKSLFLNEKERLLKELKAQLLTTGKMGQTSGEIKPPDWEINTGKEWDHTQSKFLGYPTKNFWMKKKVHGPDYDPTKIPMPCEYNQYVIDLLHKNRVRFPHINTRYDGFKPTYSHKIALEKKPPDQFDFWFTTNQYYGKQYLLDK